MKILSYLKKPSFLGLIASCAAKLLFKTVRVKIHDQGGFLDHKLPSPLIFLFWHNRIPAITATFLKIYPPMKRKGVVVLTSPSKDGDLLAAIMHYFGMGAIRGSSSRRGSTALRELQEKIAQGYDIAITPDGPRGPKYSLSTGALFLSQITETPILPLHATYHHAISLKTWDSFTIPYPFSKITITLGTPFVTSSSLDLEDQRRCLENTLLKGTL